MVKRVVNLAICVALLVVYEAIQDMQDTDI